MGLLLEPGRKGAVWRWGGDSRISAEELSDAEPTSRQLPVQPVGLGYRNQWRWRRSGERWTIFLRRRQVPVVVAESYDEER